METPRRGVSCTGFYSWGVTGTSMKNRICGAFLVLLLLCAGSVCQAAEPRRLHVVILPTENTTGLQVWESKYYPYNVLENFI